MMGALRDSIRDSIRVTVRTTANREVGKVARDVRAQLVRQGFTFDSVIDMSPDPGLPETIERSRDLRPAWAAKDPRWREQADALDATDRAWIEHQWEIAGGAGPEVDTTWVTTEAVGPPDWPLVAAVAILVGLVLVAVFVLPAAVLQ
jgi:uncharacterized protein YwbE